MKIFTVLLFLILSTQGVLPVHAQKDHPINFLDINNAKLHKTFNYNEKARVRIDNINRFLYKVSEEKTEEDFNVTVPTILSSLKLPSFLASQSPSAGSPPTNKKVVINGQPASTLQAALVEKFQDLVKTYRTINEAIGTHNHIVHLSKNCEHTFTQIETNVKNELIPFVGGASGDRISDLADKMETLLTEKIDLSNNIVNDMEELLKGWKDAALTDYRASQVINDDKLAGLKDKSKEKRDLERKIKQNDEDFERFKKDNEAFLEKAKIMLAEINKYEEGGNIYTLVDDIRKVNKSNYTYYSETVVLKKDEYRFQINAISEELLPCNKANEQKIEVVLRTRGGAKLDFSTGVFAMAGSKDFLGRSYYYKSISTTESSIAAADNGKRALLGLGALMHVYKRSPSIFKLGGALGVSSTFNFDALNFHIGPSIIVGDKDRFCITLGITVREVDLLDEKYVLENVYNKEDLPDGIPTYKMFPKSGGFFSFTYSISRFNK